MSLIKYPSIKNAKGRIFLHDSKLRGPGKNGIEHHHNDLEINLITCGEAVYMIEDECYQVKKDTLILLKPNTKHRLINFSLDMLMHIGFFQNDIIDDKNETILPKPKSIKTEETEALSHLMTDISKCESHTKEYNAGLKWCIERTKLIYQRGEISNEYIELHPTIQKAASILEDPNYPYDLTALAKSLDVHPSRLSRMFKAQLNCTITDFRNQKRIDNFFKNYDHSCDNMKNSVIKAGFGSYAQFYRIFVKHINSSPNDFFSKYNK